MSTAFERSHPVWAYKAPAVAYAALIFAMSAIPGYQLPDQPFWSFDKLVHTIEFGLLGMLLFRAFRYPRPVWRPYWAAVLTGALYAASDEVHQLFVPGRHGDVWDLAVDVAGVIIFAGISAHLHRSRPSAG